jgi:O-antigen ligase
VVLWLGGWWLLRQSGQPTRPLWLLAGLAALGCLAMAPFLGTERFQRLLDFSQGTGFLRIQLWRSAWQMALDHLPFGVGPDNFLYTYRSGYILPEAWQEPNLNHPHNWLLDWWTRLGLIGLALGLGFWASGIAKLWRRFRAADEALSGEGVGDVALTNAALVDERRIWALGFLAASLAALAHGWIDLSYALPDLMIVWCTMFFLLGETGSDDRFQSE